MPTPESKGGNRHGLHVRYYPMNCRVLLVRHPFLDRLGLCHARLSVAQGVTQA